MEARAASFNTFDFIDNISAFGHFTKYTITPALGIFAAVV